MIGNTLKLLRKKHNLTQDKFSNILGIAQTTYAGYETNKHIPDIFILIKISDYFNISLDYLTGRYDKK